MRSPIDRHQATAAAPSHPGEPPNQPRHQPLDQPAHRPPGRRPWRGWGAAVTAAAVIAALTVLPGPGSARAADTLLSQGRPATASSTENADYFPAPAAVDGDPSTRWSSTFADPQWLAVDLGVTATINRVELDWETAHATAYQIQTSSDSKTWTTIYSTTTGAGGSETVAVTGTGRYIRMYATARANGYGDSLWEFKVYGIAGSAAGPTPTPTPSLTPTPTPTPSPSGAGWTPVFTDGFDGPSGSSPAGGTWLTRTGTQYPGGSAHWGTGSVETDRASADNLSLDGNGHLILKAIRDASGNWTSGRIETNRSDFAAQPGEQLKLTAVLRQPDVANALGYWPGFRATGAAFRDAFTGWPGIGETDIMTDVNGRSQLSNTLHCGTAPGGVCDEYNGRTSGLATCDGCQAGFHEYSQVIDRTTTDEQIRFYLDGKQTWVVRESQVGVDAWNKAVHHGFYLRLDLAIGGSLPDAIAGTTTPTSATTSGGSLVVDSVSVSKQVATPAPAMTNPTVPAGPSRVHVTGTQGNWALQVNGQPYYVKGLTYGPPQDAGDGYLRDLAGMGANTIRIWGVDDTATPQLLDTAARNGMKVIVGNWLNQGADYVNDTAYKDSTKAEILRRVQALKGHQGVLMWDLGNEVLLTMQDHGLAPDVVEARRVAYTRRIIHEVHLV